MKKVLVVCAVMALAGWANAELLIGFNMQGLPGTGPNVTSVYQAVNIEISYLSRGAGLSASTGTNSLNSTGWTVGLTADDALANNDYYTLTITASSGYQFSITNIEWRISRSGTGPTNMTLRSSLDTFTADLATWIYTGTAQVNLSNGLSLAYSPTVELRILGYQAGAAAGTLRVADGASFGQAGIDFAVYGDVVAIPEPGTLAMLGIGMAVLALQRRFRR